MSLVPVGNIAVRVGVVGGNSFNKAFAEMGAGVAGWASFSRAKFKQLGVAFSAVGGGILFATKKMVEGAKEFDAAMRNIQTVSQATRLDIWEMESGIRAVANATNQTATEAARGFYQIASSGFDGAEGLQVLKAASMSAAAGITSVDTASRGIVAVLNSYALGADQAADVSDILFQTVNLGVGTFEELTSVIGDVVGIAAQIGVSFAEISAAIAAASRSGIAFNEGATGISRIMQDMLDPTDALSQMLREMGYESGQAALQGLGFQGVLEQIRQRVGDNAAAYVTLFQRIDGTKVALALAANEGRTYADVADQITDKQKRAGAAANAFKIQLSGMNAKAADLRNSITSLAQSALLPMLRLFEGTTSMFVKLLDALDKLHPAIKAAAAAFVIMSAALLFLIGAAFIALPRMAILAAVALTKLAITHNHAAMAAIRQALANDKLSWSMRKGLAFMTDATIVTKTAKGVMLWGRYAAAIMFVVVAFDQLYRKGKTAGDAIAAVNEKATDDEVKAAAQNYADLIERMDELSRSVGGQDASGLEKVIRLVSGSGGTGAWGEGVVALFDKIAQTSFSTITQMEAADKAFKDLARGQPEAAKRMIETAKAAGVEGEAIEYMSQVLYEATKATKETADATGIGLEQYQTAGGAIIEISETIAEELDTMREAASELAGAWGGMFADPLSDLQKLKDAVVDADEAVADAERDAAKIRGESSKDQAGSVRDLAKAQREHAKAERELLDIQSKRPKRQKGERKTDYEARIADELADAQERVGDTAGRITELQEGGGIDAAGKMADADERLADAKERQKEANESLVVSGEQLMKNLQAQNQSLATYHANLLRLQQRLGPAGARMLNKIRGMGAKEAGAEVKALVDMTDQDLQQYLKLWQDTQAISTGIALGSFDVMKDEGKAKMEELWAQVGGDVGRFIELGAVAGEAALTDFINNKIGPLSEEARYQMEQMLPPEWRIKLSFDMPRAGALEQLLFENGYITGKKGGTGALFPGLTGNKSPLASPGGVDIAPVLGFQNPGILAGGGAMATGSQTSTVVNNTYTIDTIEVPDPAAFQQWVTSRQRLSNLGGGTGMVASAV